LTDYVSVRDLAVSAVIGVHPWEREIEQTLVVSVEMAADVAKAAASDDLADALDYSAVAETIAAVLRDGKFRLIETAAERVAGRLLADFALSWLRLELRKPIASAPATPAPAATSVTPASTLVAPPAYTAVITIERTREIP
jgi:7,8-dihydroneopterin aldolase/epimerase/oxygenase